MTAKRWQYVHRLFVADHMVESIRRNAGASEQNSTVGWQAFAAEMMALGNDGWEAFAAFQHNPGSATFFFKREAD